MGLIEPIIAPTGYRSSPGMREASSTLRQRAPASTGMQQGIVIA